MKCIVCGNEFEGKETRKVCSRKCVGVLCGRAKHLKHPQYGIDNPNYKHGFRCNDNQIKLIRTIKSRIQVKVENGNIKKEPCEICETNENVLAHHDDYSKPFEVRWLCRKHHGNWHRENDSPVKAFIESELF